MATIRRRNGRYHVQIRRKGFPPITNTFSRLTVAKRWIGSIEADIENKMYVDCTAGRTSKRRSLLHFERSINHNRAMEETLQHEEAP